MGLAASVAEGLIGLGRPRRLGKRGGRRQRPCYRPSHLAGGVHELETRCLLSHAVVGHHAHTATAGGGAIHTDQASNTLTFPDLPSAGNQTSAGAVMFINTNEIAGQAEPVTITNNYGSTVYPILSAINAPSNNGQPYDPNDASNEEYRTYVGYSDATGNHLGLKSGQSITFNLPQALWGV
jgi:hypothetical protein